MLMITLCAEQKKNKKDPELFFVVMYGLLFAVASLAEEHGL